MVSDSGKLHGKSLVGADPFMSRVISGKQSMATVLFHSLSHPQKDKKKEMNFINSKNVYSINKDRIVIKEKVYQVFKNIFTLVQ